MSLYPTKAPHMAGARDPLNVAPNAALLIDFDNVTMGMRSDLSKELKNLLNSDIIKGKVTVQRAYADWRRYPQYIVPLSEASIDLIFAPAYGANKKNATDIRMAIDGIELVFIRPEIGTFILLTGDSDFSSMVLKLKEYGKYVIGVGIQESSSDILVQNCDEYYSYTSITGLRKTTDSDRQAMDPWVLVERAVEQMVSKNDVMRSDRLKQVMVELDPGFDEGNLGFSKFSRFITEASSKGLLKIRKLENGQYEVEPAKGGGARSREETRSDEPAPSSGRGGRGRGRGGERSRGRERTERPESRGAEAESAPVPDGPPLQAAYDLLRRALERLKADGREAVRDSDVKRRMLEIEPGFDEENLGFEKFSRFLRQAADHSVITLHKRDTGNFEVSLADGGRAPTPVPPAGARTPSPEPRSEPTPSQPVPQTPVSRAPVETPVQKESALAAIGRRFGLFLGAPKKEEAIAPPAPAPAVASAPAPRPREEPFVPREEPRAPEHRREPQSPAAEPAPGAENVLEQWKADFERRAQESPFASGGRSEGAAAAETESEPREPREPRRRGGRGRGRGGARSEGRDEPRSEAPVAERSEPVAEQRFEPAFRAEPVQAELVPEPRRAAVHEEAPVPSSPLASGPAEPVRSEPQRSEPVRSEPTPPALAAEPETPGEFDGLAPSRLRGRTSKKRHS